MGNVLVVGGCSRVLGFRLCACMGEDGREHDVWEVKWVGTYLGSFIYQRSWNRWPRVHPALSVPFALFLSGSRREGRNEYIKHVATPRQIGRARQGMGGGWTTSCFGEKGRKGLGRN